MGNEEMTDAAPAVRVTPASTLLAIARFLVRARGDRKWDLYIRGTGLLALGSIPLVLWMPSSVPLVAYTLFGAAANGPFSPLLPVAFEPMILEVAKYESPMVVASVGVFICVYAEFLNLHIYRWILFHERLSGFRNHVWVKRSVNYFARWPFGTTIVFAFTPLPFWVARILGVLNRYSLPRFLAATAIGRFPRMLIYAWLGNQLELPGVALASVGIGATLLVVAIRFKRRQRLLVDPLVEAEGNDASDAA